MVVVDNARKMIGKTIEISVTSVLQTTAGKMIFGKFDERAATAAPRGGTETRPERQDLRKNNPQPSFPAANGTTTPPSSPGIPAASSSGTGGNE
jgi:hypothetical protein